jgi:hypothetical protein
MMRLRHTGKNKARKLPVGMHRISSSMDIRADNPAFFYKSRIRRTPALTCQSPADRIQHTDKPKFTEQVVKRQPSPGIWYSKAPS